MTEPTLEAWMPRDALLDVLCMRDEQYQRRQYGPFTLQMSKRWDLYLDMDYMPDLSIPKTLRERLLQIEGLERVVVSDGLPGFAAELKPAELCIAR